MSSRSDRPEIALATMVVASPEQVSSDLDGETVVLNLRDARYYGFDGVAARLWELLQAPVRVTDLCETIVAEYEVTPEQCRADVLVFLGALAEKGLLEVRAEVRAGD